MITMATTATMTTVAVVLSLNTIHPFVDLMIRKHGGQEYHVFMQAGAVT
jgi:hypothetical protein